MRVVDLWPEHGVVWDVWRDLAEAWNLVAGMNGVQVVGFDRCQALAVMQMHGVKRKKQRALLNALTAMEAAALPVLNAR